MASLEESIDFNALIGGGTVIKVRPENVTSSANWEVDNDESEEYVEDNYKAFNLDKSSLDEEAYVPGEDFRSIAPKMFNLLADGKIKKRIIRKGKGNRPNELDTVKIHYNAYLNCDMEPFDSTFNRNKTHKFKVNDGKVLAGLDYAVQTMEPGEKAEFLIHPDYAYGKNLLFGRVPPNAEVLFQVVLVDVVFSGAAVAFQSLPEEAKKTFPEVAKYCEALCERAKASVAENKIDSAIKDYNTGAYAMLELLSFSAEESMTRLKLLLRMFTNLVVCYTKNQLYRKSCKAAEKLYELTEKGEILEIPTKVYYCHGKSLRMLGEFSEAKIFLEKAFKRRPNDTDIISELYSLENDKTEQKSKQTLLGKALLGNI